MLGVIAHCSLDFLTEVGRRLSAATGEARETTTFLFQRIFVAIKRFNVVLIHESFIVSVV